MKLAKVKTAGTDEILVAITSEDKPEISEDMQSKWQKIVDLAAKIIGVPSGLLTRLHEDKLEVFLSSSNKENIFEPNLMLDLGMGWYCENVTGTRDPLVVQNALNEDEWKNNPSVPFNMISYMGIPIQWPDGEVFGTFCMLDNKENKYSELYKDLLISLREIIQNDLKSTLLFKKAQNDLLNKESQIREIHHNIKNHFNLLISSLNLQAILDSNSGSIESVLSDIQARICAISLIHDKLYRSVNLEDILLGDYLNELAKHIINTLAKRKVEFECSGDSINVASDISVPCGLIINELITNSLKYAFDGTSSPKIMLNIKKTADEKVSLHYKDNGKGIDKNYDPKNSETLGMLLINQLTKQLGGDLVITSDFGFVFQTEFALRK